MRPSSEITGASFWRTALVLAAAALSVLARPVPVWSGDRPLTVSQLVESSSSAVLVRITDVKSEWITTPAGPLPFIVYKARNLKVLDGLCPLELELVTPGMVSADLVITSIDEPSFAPGEEALLFLQPAAAGAPDRPLYRITGGAAGALPVIKPADHAPAYVLAPAPRPGPSGRPHALVRLSDLEAQVRAVRQNLDQAEKAK